MAKRKRLSPPSVGGAPEMKSASATRAPIADVAGAASAWAAFETVSDEISEVRRDGRMVERLPIEAVDTSYLMRDRMVLDADELAALKDSIAERGQQAPIEVVGLEGDRYGLISGWRRLTALTELYAETGAPEFSVVQALVRTPQTAGDAYVAMIEENEIRAPLSFYERARVAALAAEKGAFPTPEIAIKSLYSRANKSKRSKIKSFLTLYQTLDDALRFPAHLNERLGLQLVKFLGARKDAGRLVREALKASAPADGAAEMAVLKSVMADGASAPARPKDEVIPGIHMARGPGRVSLSGPGVDAALEDALRAWLIERRS